MSSLETLVDLYNNGVLSEFMMGKSITEKFAKNEITKEEYKHICDYFTSVPSNRYKGIIGKETWEYIVSIGLEK